MRRLLLMLGRLLTCTLLLACGSEQRSDQGASPEAAPDVGESPAPAPATDVSESTAVEPAAPDAGASEASSSSDAVVWRLDASATRLTMAERDAFRVRIHATNGGPTPVQPTLYQGTFAVDGATSRALGMAFSNGAMERGWIELPPGETVTAERAMGETLFPAPGRYVLSYTRGTTTSSVEIVVVP